MRIGKFILRALLFLLLATAAGAALYLYPTWKAAKALGDGMELPCKAFGLEVELDREAVSQEQEKMLGLLARLTGMPEDAIYRFSVQGSALEGKSHLLIYPDGRTEHFSYDSNGFLSEKTDEAGNTTRYENDAKGRVIKETRADGAARTFSYDSAGQILTESDFSGNVTAYVYDAHENPVKVTDGSGRSVACTYDALNRRTSLTDGNGNTTTYHYEGTEAVPASATDGDGSPPRPTRMGS